MRRFAAGRSARDAILSIVRTLRDSEPFGSVPTEDEAAVPDVVGHIGSDGWSRMGLKLEEVLAELIEPEMTVFIDSTAMAPVRALAKVFHGMSPNLAVVVPRGGMIAPELIGSNLIRKLVSGGLLNPHLGRIPPAVVQRAYRNDVVEFELLSLQTTALRLMAGAMGWPFVASRSIGGSDLETRYPTAVRRLEDPFEGEEAVVLRPLVTDIAIGHAVFADLDGHAIFPDSSDHGGWGLRSSSRGVIVVAEATVDSVSSSALGQRWIPASSVLAVCEAPHCAAPYAFPGSAPGITDSYGDDRSALRAYSASLSANDRGKSQSATSGGAEAVERQADEAVLRRRSMDDAERPDGDDRPRRDLTLAESVFLAGSELARRITNGGLNALLEGSGKAKLISRYATMLLGEQGFHVDRVGGVGGLNEESVGRSPVEAYGYLLGGVSRRSVGVLSGLQIDRCGNINNTELIEHRTMLVGSGGANDAGSMCDEILVITSGRTGSLVRRVDFVTVPGQHVSLVIAGRCVFERQRDGGELRFCRLLGGMTPSVRQILYEARKNGWSVDTEPELVPLPDAADEVRLRSLLGK
jgi:acyl CoA:acetate/3-ketoacid CoA transferase alpha subunit